MAILAGLQGVDLSTVNIKYPCIATGLYPFKIESVEQKTAKSGGSQLVLTLVTEVDAQDIEGKPLPAGYKITHYISTSAVGKRTLEQCAQDVARLQEAAFGHRIPVESFDTDMLIGQVVVAKTKTEESDEYGTQPRIAKFVPKDETATA